MSFYNMKLHNTTIRRELLAGISTFVSMSYILSLNPKMLSTIGMDYDGVFIATIIATVLTTLFSACYTKMPMVYAPAVSYNIIFFPMLCSIAKGDWQLMLFATYLSGILIILLVNFGIYDKVDQFIPDFLKYSIVAGIGLAIIIAGTNMLNIVEKLNGRYSFGILKKEVLYCVIALGILYILKKKEKRYAITIAVAITYGIIILAQAGISIYQNNFSLHQMFGNYADTYRNPLAILNVSYQFPRLEVFYTDKNKMIQLLSFVFMMTLTHFLDAYGSGVATVEEIRKDDANFDSNALKKTITVNGVGSLISGCSGTFSVTTYAESMVGIDVGAKTGLSAIVVSICFLLSAFLSPFYKMMSGYIVAPAMLYVGYIFLMNIKKIRFQNVCQKICAAFIIVYTGITFQVGEAVIWGMLLYTVLQFVTGRRKDISKNWLLVVVLSIICIVIQWYSYQ